jgi:hypothetical protein
MDRAEGFQSDSKGKFRGLEIPKSKGISPYRQQSRRPGKTNGSTNIMGASLSFVDAR